MNSSESTIPANLTEWINHLPSRAGWGEWESVGGSVLEGVQSWSLKGDDLTSIGVWGNVVEDEDGVESVNWCVYVGDCRDAERCGFEHADNAMDWAQVTFPALF